MYIDTDMFFPNGSVDDLFPLYNVNPPVTTNHCYCDNKKDPLMLGFMLFQPQKTLFETMRTKFGSVASNDNLAKGFIQNYFKDSGNDVQLITEMPHNFINNYDRQGDFDRDGTTAIRFFVSPLERASWSILL